MSTRLVERNKTRTTRPDPRDYFDWTTPNLEVYARRTNPHVAHQISPSTLQLAQALGVAQQGLAAYQQYKGVKNKYDYEEGYLDRQQGKAVETEDKTAAYIRGWEEMNGESLAIEFEKEATNLTDSLKDKDPGTFEQAYGELYQNFLNQLGTDNETRGFLKRFNEVDRKVRLTYNQYQQAYQKQLTYEEVNGIFNDDITLKVTQLLGVSSFSDFYNNPEEYLKYAQSAEVLKNAIAPEFRKYLTQAFEKYGNLLTKPEISELFLNNAATLAEMYDMPELIEYAFLKDEVGIAVFDNEALKNRVQAAYQNALNGRTRKLNQVHQEMNRINKEYTTRKQNELTYRIALLQPNQQEEAKQILSEILTDDVLMADSGTSVFAKSLEDILEGNGHPENSDTEVYDYIQHRILIEGLTEKDLLQYKTVLSRKDYEDFWNDLQAQARRHQARREALGLTAADAYKKRKTDVINAIKSDAEAVDNLQLAYTQGAAITPSLINRLHVKVAELEREKGYISEEDMETKIIKPFQEEIAIIKQGIQEAVEQEEQTKGKKNKKQQPSQTKSEQQQETIPIPKGLPEGTKAERDPITGEIIYILPSGKQVRKKVKNK